MTLHQWYGESPFVTGNFGLPFAGFVQRLSMPFDQSGRIPTHGLAMIWIGLQLLLCLAIPFLKSDWLVKLLAFDGAALIALAGWPIYEHWYGSLRVFTWTPLAIWIWAVQSGRSWPAWLTLLALPWPLLAVASVWR